MTTWTYDTTIPTKLISVTTTSSTLVFPQKITVIQDGDRSFSPFYNCRDVVTSFSFESNSALTTLGTFCFYSSKALRTADFSNCLKLTAISHACFLESGVESVILPEGGALKVFYYGAFAYSKLKTIKIPDTLEEIYGHSTEYGGSSFSVCQSLTKIEISKTSKLKTIGYAIAQYTIVESMFVPRYVTSFNSGAFNYMLRLSSLTVDSDNPVLVSIDNIIYSKDQKTLHFCACNKQTPIVNLDTVVEISAQAFRGCRIRNDYTIPNGVVAIDSYTFSSSLFNTVILPNTVKFLYQNSFIESELKTIRIPSSVQKIYIYAFSGAYIQKIFFEEPSSSITIDNDAFCYTNHLVSIFIPKERNI